VDEYGRDVDETEMIQSRHVIATTTNRKWYV